MGRESSSIAVRCLNGLEPALIKGSDNLGALSVDLPRSTSSFALPTIIAASDTPVTSNSSWVSFHNVTSDELADEDRALSLGRTQPSLTDEESPGLASVTAKISCPIRD
jgi:hypothetical protein